MMLTIDAPSQAAYMISNQNPLYEGLIIHGYGSNKEEIAGLALALAKQLKLKLLVVDLPGHGWLSNEQFNLKNCLTQLRKSLTFLSQPQFFVGHSIGARLGLMLNLPFAVCVSPPGAAFFEGRRQELVRTLRYQRVNESSAYAGLQEILAVNVPLAKRTLLLEAEHELKSVNAFVNNWKSKASVDSLKIKNCQHLDIISQPQTQKETAAWLKQVLKRQ